VWALLSVATEVFRLQGTCIVQQQAVLVSAGHLSALFSPPPHLWLLLLNQVGKHFLAFALDVQHFLGLPLLL
jgi:hypothetical protein